MLDEGYERSSLTEVEAVLDSLSPATSEQVYSQTLGMSPRAVAAVAASRADAAGGGASFPDEWTVRDDGSTIIHNSDPAIGTLEVQGAVGQIERIFEVTVNDGLGGDDSLFSISPPGGSGLQYSPNPNNNSTTFVFADTGHISFEDEDGDEYLAYAPGNKRLQLDPENGGPFTAAGSLVFSNSEPADGSLPFSGCFAFYAEGGVLKAKANVGGDRLHLTIGTFA